jgi:hypothetical protein
VPTQGEALLAQLPDVPSDYLLTLPPADVLFEGLTSQQLHSVADLCFDACLEVLAGTRRFDREAVEYRCGGAGCEKVHSVTPDAAARRLLMICGITWGTATERLFLDRSNVYDLSDRPLVRFIERLPAEPDESNTSMPFAHSALRCYASVLAAAQALLLFRAGAYVSPSTDELEAALVNNALDLYHVFAGLMSPEGLDENMDGHYLLLRLVGNAFHVQRTVFNMPARAWSETHKAGPFSSLRLSQLQLLARRSDDALARYGPKEVERVFEQQLALLMQSLGFYVVPARIGEASPDLICMSADSGAQFTILCDAKSSASPYSLPKDDFRALEDYVADARTNLVSAAPSLLLVLIVGGDASNTLAKRLRQLEATIGMPVRFCTAQQLADLRENVPGAIPMSALREALLKASNVLKDPDIQKVVKVATEREEAKAHIVRTFMSH